MLKRNLIGADAKCTDGEQALAGIENRRRDLRLAANAENVNVFDLFDQVAFGECARHGFDGKTIGDERRLGHRVDVFEEQDFDFALGERRDSGHGRKVERPCGDG